MEYRIGQIRDSNTTNDAEGDAIRIGVVDGVTQKGRRRFQRSAVVYRLFSP